jgi:hypothetical protein
MEKTIKNLVKFGNRQGDGAYKAYTYIISQLKECNIAYITEIYTVDLPLWKKTKLTVDGVNIPCLPTGLTSGKINTDAAVTSSLISSLHFLHIPHINFNPKSRLVSRANFSVAPSIAVSRDSIIKINKAKKIVGNIVVEKVKNKTYQILVGNLKNPKNIIFSHFDSVGTGAIDNASGTAIMMETVKNPEYIKENLFVFDGNEELSYDSPIYWGKGYRNFEKKYSKQMQKARKLLVVDCVGYKDTDVLSSKKSDQKIIRLAFPIKNIGKFSKKIKLITSDYDSLMRVYHSDSDQPKLIRKKYLAQAFNCLCKEIV